MTYLIAKPSYQCRDSLFDGYVTDTRGIKEHVHQHFLSSTFCAAHFAQHILRSTFFDVRETFHSIPRVF
jgi:hypothetical protein